MPSQSSSTTRTSALEQRLSSVEQWQRWTEGRMDKYDQMLGEIRNTTTEIKESTLKHDLLNAAFIEEMKELKQQGIDVSKLLDAYDKRMDEHEKKLEQQGHAWSIVSGVLKWVLGLVTLALTTLMGILMGRLHLF